MNLHFHKILEWIYGKPNKGDIFIFREKNPFCQDKARILDYKDGWVKFIVYIIESRRITKPTESYLSYSQFLYCYKRSHSSFDAKQLALMDEHLELMQNDPKDYFNPKDYETERDPDIEVENYIPRKPATMEEAKFIEGKYSKIIDPIEKAKAEIKELF